MPSQQATETDVQGRQELLLFRLNGRQRFGINVLKIREIIPYERLNQLPYSHPAVVGLAHLRGEPLPVIDLAAAIGGRHLKIDDENPPSIIITEFNRCIQGFLVTDVERIMNCSWKDVLPPPRNTGRSSYITGVTNFEETLIEVIDVERVLHEVTPQEDSVAAGFVSKLDEQHLAVIKDKTILMVDDSRMARHQIARTLEAIGVDFFQAQDGKEALALLRDLQKNGRHVDMIISDIEMPEMDGYTLTREVRKDQDETLASTYILLHTSLASTISEENASKSGANAALTKFVADELTEAVIEGLSVS